MAALASSAAISCFIFEECKKRFQVNKLLSIIIITFFVITAFWLLFDPAHDVRCVTILFSIK